MIVRTSPTVIIDHGPWRSDGVGMQHAEVSVRYLEPVDLARVDRTPPGPRRIAGILSRREADMAAARKRGSEATKRAFRHQKASDDAVLGALRATGGNAYRAAQLLGITKTAITSRMTTLERLGLVPDDVYALVDARRRA